MVFGRKAGVGIERIAFDESGANRVEGRFIRVSPGLVNSSDDGAIQVPPQQITPADISRQINARLLGRADKFLEPLTK
jgi:hypothetical protein